MMNHASFPSALRYGLCAEAAARATLIENMLLMIDKTTAPYVRFFGK
jgi:hypothetical protein